MVIDNVLFVRDSEPACSEKFYWLESLTVPMSQVYNKYDWGAWGVCVSVCKVQYLDLA